MRPDDVNFSLSTSSEILSEKADLIAMEVDQSAIHFSRRFRLHRRNLVSLTRKTDKIFALSNVPKLYRTIPAFQPDKSTLL